LSRRQPDEKLADTAGQAPALKSRLPNPTEGAAMSQHAIIRGEVSFRAGDGVLLPVPAGPVDIELADDSVVLSWEDGPGNAATAAITRDEYERYLREGKIRLQA
jgi:hypothetical protein